MHSYDNKKLLVYVIKDPEAAKVIHLFKAPHAIEVLSAYAASDTTLAAGTANYFSLQGLNYGTAGTSNGGTVLTEVRGTVGWAAATPYAFTVSEGTVAADEYVVLNYAETGTVPVNEITVCIEYVDGIGA